MQRDEILEYPYEGVIYHTIVGKGDEDDQSVEIYRGVMDETLRTDNEGRLLRTSSYILSIPLIQDNDGKYVIPKVGDTIDLVRYGETIKFSVDNAEPSQLGGVSIYATRKKWD